MCFALGVSARASVTGPRTPMASSEDARERSSVFRVILVPLARPRGLKKKCEGELLASLESRQWCRPFSCRQHWRWRFAFRAFPSVVFLLSRFSKARAARGTTLPLPPPFLLLDSSVIYDFQARTDYPESRLYFGDFLSFARI